MKDRLITAVVIAVAAVMISIASVMTTITITSKVTEQTKQLQSGEHDAAALELFVEQWTVYEKILSCYIRHTEIEDISRSVEMLETIYNQDNELFVIECSRIISASEHLKRTELPLFCNIF